MTQDEREPQGGMGEFPSVDHHIMRDLFRVFYQIDAAVYYHERLSNAMIKQFEECVAECYNKIPV